MIWAFSFVSKIRMQGISFFELYMGEVLPNKKNIFKGYRYYVPEFI